MPMSHEGFRSNLDIKDVSEQIQACIDEDQNIERELDELLGRRSALEKEIDRVMYPAEAHSLQQNIEGLTKKIADTSITAFSLSSKVRKLDVAQARLKETIDHIEKIVNLKTTIEKVNVLIEKKSYGEAAEMTFQVLHKEETKLINDASFEVILGLEKKLVDLVSDDCGKACVKAAVAAKKRAAQKPEESKLQELGVSTSDEKKGDQEMSPEFARVFDLCKILPKLDQQSQGLSKYCIAARTMLVVGSKKLTLPKNLNPSKFPDKLSEMLDAIAFCIQTHNPILTKFFGPGSVLRLIQELLEECDNKIHELVSRFIEANKIAKISKTVDGFRRNQKKSHGGSNTGKSASQYNPKMLDGLLEQAAYILREIQIFDYNIRQLGERAREKLSETPSQQKLLKAMRANHRLKDSLPRTTKVNQLQHQLTSYYITIEEYFMSKDVKTAISLDDDSDEAQTSSMVDDVFYIVKKCSERAFSTCDINSACAIVNLLNDLLFTMYKDQLNSRVEGCWENIGNLSTLIFNQDQKAQNKAEDALIQDFNNLQVSAKHILTLKSYLEEHAKEVFRHIPTAVKMALSCLEALNDSSESFMRIVHKNLNKFVDMEVEKVNGPQALGSLLERFSQQSYELRESEYTTQHANDVYVPKLIHALSKQHQALESRLTDANLDLVLHALANHVVKVVGKFYRP